MRSIILGLFCFILFGCEDNTTDPTGLDKNSIIINLNKSEYKKDEIAELSIKNNSEVDLILINCALQPGFDIEKNVDGNWAKPYSITCAGIGEPFSLAKKTTLKIQIHFPIFENQLDKIEGSYRLKLWLENAINRILIADSLRMTSPFEIITN